MNYQPHTDDAILGEILLRDDRYKTETAPGDSPEFDELFGLFLEGQLQNEDRTRFFQLLDDSPELRRLFGDYAEHLSFGHERPLPEPVPKPPIRSTQSYWAVCLLTAVVLVGFGLVFFGGRKQVTERQLYTEARQELQESRFESLKKRLLAAKKRGIDSPRLQNLLAQATLQIPAEASLDVQGTLLDFDVRPNGVLLRDFNLEETEIPRWEQARSELEQIPSPQETHLLNLAYIQLRRHPDQPQIAKAVFQQVIDRNPKNSAAWLGRGLASFLQDIYAVPPPEEPFAEARNDFQQSLKLNSQNNVARINLAMTFAMQGRPEEALKHWQQVDLEKLNPPEREQIEREIHRLSK